ncbi:MAG: permease [Bacteroidota bacterium]
MGIALQKTIAFLLLIGIGVLLKKKVTSKEQLKGIKALILSIALPATIFIALLKIEIQPSLMLLPVLALAANFLLLGGTKIFTKIAGISSNSPKARTLLMLVPSFAPGLSCFPFVVEFLGDESLAMAAFADVGNKIFVLIILYIVAMRWYYKLLAKKSTEVASNNSRLKDLGLSLLREPINLVLVAAILMLCFGLNFASLPNFLQDTISRMSLLMTPMVLLFIGIAVKLRKGDIKMMLQILFWRSGFAFLISAGLLMVLPSDLPTYMLLLAVAFPQSACSFWPFAHMTAVESLEKDKENVQTFNLDLALNMLAFSLPFSTIIILTICASGDVFANTFTVTSLGVVFLVVALLPFLLKAKNGVKNVLSYEKVVTSDS